jgi:hypothetical protein
MASRRQQMNVEHHERRPPDIESIKRERELRVREIQMETVLKNFITYLIYVLILLFIAYNNRDPRLLPPQRQHSEHICYGRL